MESLEFDNSRDIAEGLMQEYTEALLVLDIKIDGLDDDLASLCRNGQYADTHYKNFLESPIEFLKDHVKYATIESRDAEYVAALRAALVTKIKNLKSDT